MLMGCGIAAVSAMEPPPSDYWQLPIPPQGEPPADAVELTKALDAPTCGLCHPQQYADWQGSLHARAAGPGLLGQLVAFDPEQAVDCLRCHAPRSEQQHAMLADPLTSRGEGGVDCAGCHLRAHRRFGPEQKPITPHGRVTGLTLFRDSAFCAPCHQFPDGVGELAGKPLENTHAEWAGSRHAAAGRTCQRCHMPEGSHRFRGIHDSEMTRQALSLSVERMAAGLRVLARNTGAGHALPTYATPRIRIRMRQADDAARERVHVIARTLVWEPAQGLSERADTRLMPDEVIELRLGLPPGARGRVEVEVEPDAFYHDVVYPVLLNDLDDDAHARARGLILRARHATGESAYRLFEADCGPWSGRPERCEVRVPGS